MTLHGTIFYEGPSRQQQALKAAELLYREPFLTFTVPIDGRSVSTWGLKFDCWRFSAQRRVVFQRGDRWPCVLINMPETDGFSTVAPVDLGLLPGPRSKLRDLKPDEDLENVVGPYLEQAGFSSVFTQSSDEAYAAFISGIARVLYYRRNRLDDNTRPDPPVRCRVTITTRENLRRILYAKGYFISTVDNFGTSTPAQRRLPSGYYLFGMLVRGVARYEQYVWQIDEDIVIPLEVK